MKYSSRNNHYQKEACFESFICKNCGHLSPNRIAADDNPVKLMSIALGPLARPAFPLHEIGGGRHEL